MQRQFNNPMGMYGGGFPPNPVFGAQDMAQAYMGLQQFNGNQIPTAPVLSPSSFVQTRTPSQLPVHPGECTLLLCIPCYDLKPLFLPCFVDIRSCCDSPGSTFHFCCTILILIFTPIYCSFDFLFFFSASPSL